jgi:hypothetical protein
MYVEGNLGPIILASFEIASRVNDEAGTLNVELKE